MDGIIIINKPTGITSFGVVAKLRKILGQKKIGHMGTLDPMATGVLPIVVGQATKFQIFATQKDKKYTARIKLGITTDTLDITGKTLSQKKSFIKKENLKKALENFNGEILQIPPAYSAIKKDGQKMCDLARKGRILTLDPRKVTIKSLKLNEFDEKNQSAEIEVWCSEGTYIRSLCSDIGKILACGAVMSGLKRTLSNGFDIKNSVKLEELESLTLQEIQEKHLLPIPRLFEGLNIVNITLAQATRFKSGGGLMLDRLDFESAYNDKDTYELFCENEFIGIGQIDNSKNELKILKAIS